eukprot:2675854-Rhodomonas_salina.3
MSCTEIRHSGPRRGSQAPSSRRRSRQTPLPARCMRCPVLTYAYLGDRKRRIRTSNGSIRRRWRSTA